MTEKDLRAVLAQLFKLASPKTDVTKIGVKAFDERVDRVGEAAAPPTRDVRKKLGDSLLAVCGNGSGGVFAEWRAGTGRAPVVYFGSEGQLQIAAAGLREFLGLLAYRDRDGWNVMDAMAHCQKKLTTLPGDVGTASDVVTSQPRAAIEPTVAEVLAAGGVSIPPDLLGAVEAANQAHLWAFFDAIDLAVCGHKAFRLWFEAWSDDARPAHDFSPQERYAVGDKLRYVSKVRGEPVVGRGVVLANPAPNRVLIADEHNTFLRVCAEPTK